MGLVGAMASALKNGCDKAQPSEAMVEANRNAVAVRAAGGSVVAMSSLKLPDRETRIRVLRFLAVGGGSAGVQFIVLALLKGWMAETLAFSLSWVVSTGTHYLANRFWALPSGRHDAAKQFGEYMVAVGLSYVINLGAFKLCQSVFGLGLMWAAFWAIPPSTIVVFLILNYRVFRARAA
jgi:putative flippase GtrA